MVAALRLRIKWARGWGRNPVPLRKPARRLSTLFAYWRKSRAENAA